MSKTLLIAEDDRFLANAYKLAFEGKGYTVLIAYDGEEALKVMRSQPVDVLILDLLMPKKDGFGVLADMRADEKIKNIPVIVASNLGSEEDKQKATTFGVRDYIVKSETTISAVIGKVEALGLS